MSIRETIKKIENKIDSLLVNLFDNQNENINKIPIYVSKKKRKIKKDIINKKILIFGGGGVKGIAYVGVLRALEENLLLKNINTFVGSSVGVFLIGMYLIGYNSYNMEDFLLNFDIGKLKSINIFNLIENYGLDSGDKLQYVLRRLISAKGYKEDINLLELYNNTKKKFIITSVCLN